MKKVLEVGPGLHPVEKFFFDSGVEYIGVDADTHRLVGPRIAEMFEHYSLPATSSQEGAVFKIPDINSVYAFCTLGRLASMEDYHGAFDLCFMANVLGDPASWQGHPYADPTHTFSRLEGVLMDVSKILKPDGALVVLEDSTERFEAKQLTSKAERSFDAHRLRITNLARGVDYLGANLDYYPSFRKRYDAVMGGLSAGKELDKELNERYVATFQKA